MGDSSEWSGNLVEGNILELTGKIIVVTIVIVLFVVVFVFALHLYAKWFWYRRRDSTTRGHFNFTAGHQESITTAALGGGLDPIILKTLPVMAFDPKFFKDGLECAVCLCEVSEGEKARLLPECNHGFHLDCIDMWLQSHSTCPLCRNPVANQKEANPGDESHLDSIVEAPLRENPSFPTNVLFWGDDSRVNSLGPCLDEENQSSGISKPSSASSSSSMGLVSNRHEGVSVIDIPRQVNGEEEQKSPTPARMRSLTRLLSCSRWVNVSSPRNVDVEQGSRSGQS